MRRKAIRTTPAATDRDGKHPPSLAAAETFIVSGSAALKTPPVGDSPGVPEMPLRQRSSTFISIGNKKLTQHETMFHIDPVCKKRLRRKEEHAILKYGGGTYYLCCKACKEEFQGNPLKYIPEGTGASQVKQKPLQ